MKTYITNFLKYKTLLLELVRRDIKVKYKKSFLGILWSLLNPLLTMLVMMVVFSHVFRSDIKNFPVYLLSGNIMFSFFSEATNMSMTSVLGSASLIKKVYIPKYIFPLSKCLSSFVNLLFSLAAVFVIMLITRVKLGWSFLLFPVPILLLLVFIMGVSLILSAYAVFFRDIIHLYSVLVLILMYLTPLFYPEKIIPGKYKLFLYINPLYHYIKFFRATILYGVLPSASNVIICTLLSFGTFILGLYLFYRKQDKFILYV